MPRFRKTVRVIAVLLALLMISVAVAEETKAPATPVDHHALAKGYEGKATEHRAEAKLHREQAKAHVKEWPRIKGEKNPHAKRLEAQSLALADEAEKRAAEADRAAEFHKFRATEAEGM